MLMFLNFLEKIKNKETPARALSVSIISYAVPVR